MTIKRSNVGGKHYYHTEDSQDKPVASVTTILSAGMGDSARFDEWRKANPEQAELATNRGTAVHSLIEAYLLRDPTFDEIAKNSTSEVLSYFSAFASRLDGLTPIKLEKAVIANTPQGAFGGTVDAIIEINGARLVVDWKLSMRPRAWATFLLPTRWGTHLIGNSELTE